MALAPPRRWGGLHGDGLASEHRKPKPHQQKHASCHMHANRWLEHAQDLKAKGDLAIRAQNYRDAWTA